MSSPFASFVIHAGLAQAAPPLPPATDYGFVSSMMGAGLGEQLVMALLVILSIISWGIMLHKSQMVRRAIRESEVFLDSFWGSKRLDAIYQRSEDLKESPVSQVFRAGYIELAKLRKKSDAAPSPMAGEDAQLGDLESIERSMKRAAAAELTALEALVPFLATTASTAPFIGLLGTVVGIINAFRDIGLTGNASLATVAPGIGGALVSTAFGLFAAIPAVVGYNFFLTRIRNIETEMHNFSSDFLNIIKRHFF
jgi:biopolymer transport protein TolQ